MRLFNYDCYSPRRLSREITSKQKRTLIFGLIGSKAYRRRLFQRASTMAKGMTNVPFSSGLKIFKIIKYNGGLSVELDCSTSNLNLVRITLVLNRVQLKNWRFSICLHLYNKNHTNLFKFSILIKYYNHRFYFPPFFKVLEIWTGFGPSAKQEISQVF